MPVLHIIEIGHRDQRQQQLAGALLAQLEAVGSMGYCIDIDGDGSSQQPTPGQQEERQRDARVEQRWLAALRSAADRFAELSQRPLSEQLRRSLLGAAPGVVGDIVVSSVPATAASDAPVRLTNAAAFFGGAEANVIVLLFACHSVQLSGASSSSVSAPAPSAAAAAGALGVAALSRPSHGISDPAALARATAAPYCVLHPRMHRRVRLSALRPAVHGVTREQLAMEVLQKSGFVGKYGA